VGSVTERKSKSGGPSTWCAQIRRKQGKKVVFSLSQTFEREAAARTWMKKKEKELDKPGALERAIAGAKSPPKPTLDAAIDRQVRESARELKKTKAQVLRSIRDDEIASMACEDIRSEHLVAFAKRLLDGEREPSTVGNYMSHLSGLFSIARPAWGYQLDAQAMADAMTVCKRLGYIAKSNQRDRRPTLEELDRLMTYFLDAWQRRPSSIPMHRVTAFAIFSMRRQAEICRLKWVDLGIDRTMVRRMKHPGSAVGKDTKTLITPEARAVALAMPAGDDRIFPFNPDSVSTAFTRACKELEIEDLHFHDLRHDGISWLSERNIGTQIVKAHSGHRTSASLDRYTNIEKIGDKYAGWQWLPIVTEPVTTASASALSAQPRGERRYKRRGRAGGRRAAPSGSAPSV
jgi:integrase